VIKPLRYEQTFERLRQEALFTLRGKSLPSKGNSKYKKSEICTVFKGRTATVPLQQSK
jgi:hypothetical protein